MIRRPLGSSASTAHVERPTGKRGKGRAGRLRRLAGNTHGRFYTAPRHASVPKRRGGFALWTDFKLEPN
jgi:hypothetical protein